MAEDSDKIFTFEGLENMDFSNSPKVSLEIYRHEQDFWWRAEVYVDAVDGLRCDLDFFQFEVVKTTPCGVWLKQLSRYYPKEPFFVLGTAKKQRAAPTKRIALDDARIRCSHEIHYKQHALKKVEAKAKFFKALVVLS
jgi:hypothetical protein